MEKLPHCEKNASIQNVTQNTNKGGKAGNQIEKHENHLSLDQQPQMFTQSSSC